MSTSSSRTDPPLDDVASWQLSAEGITVRIRWFGIGIGYAIVNLLLAGEVHQHRAELNGILLVGAIYALFDTWWSVRGRVFLSNFPLFISLMEAVFIGLLCYFDNGADSLFRFYYFLSLLVCAMRNRPTVTYLTLVLHASSYTGLTLISQQSGTRSALLMVVFLCWVTWAATALTALMRTFETRLLQLNAQLRMNQHSLENRIAERTRELQESQAMLVQQEKQAAFGLLAAGIAHEVGNPLAAISSLIQLMGRKPIDEDTREKFGLIDEQLRRIQRTLRELIDFSRPTSRSVAPADLREIIDTALNIAKYYKRMKGKSIFTEFDDERPRAIVARDQVLQVFLNLILNALDATEEGGTIRISVRPKPNESTASPRLQVIISDDGHGIPDTIRGHLFEPYNTSKSHGTGLGLFVCRQILNDCHGEITLAASSSLGTTFQIEFPGEPKATGTGHNGIPVENSP